MNLLAIIVITTILAIVLYYIHFQQYNTIINQELPPVVNEITPESDLNSVNNKTEYFNNSDYASFDEAFEDLGFYNGNNYANEIENFYT